VDADFLLTRGADLAIFGVRLRNFEPVASDPGALSAGQDAHIVLVLPPQHIIEDVSAPMEGLAVPEAARLAAPSRIAYDVVPGTSVRLDAEGILDACRTLRSPSAVIGDTDTLIELPWRLAFTPIADGINDIHTAAALSSPAGVVGTWLARLAAQRPGSGELRLRLVDSARAAEDPGFPAVLTPNDRAQIVALAAGAPPSSKPITLTAIGGSLDAHGEWSGFRWAQRVINGRE